MPKKKLLVIFLYCGFYLVNCTPKNNQGEIITIQDTIDKPNLNTIVMKNSANNLIYADSNFLHFINKAPKSALPLLYQFTKKTSQNIEIDSSDVVNFICDVVNFCWTSEQNDYYEYYYEGVFETNKYYALVYKRLGSGSWNTFLVTFSKSNYARISKLFIGSGIKTSFDLTSEITNEHIIKTIYKSRVGGMPHHKADLGYFYLYENKATYQIQNTGHIILIKETGLKVYLAKQTDKGWEYPVAEP